MTPTSLRRQWRTADRDRARRRNPDRWYRCRCGVWRGRNKSKLCQTVLVDVPGNWPWTERRIVFCDAPPPSQRRSRE